MGGGALQRGLAQIQIQRGLFPPARSLRLYGISRSLPLEGPRDHELAELRGSLTGARVVGGLPGTKRGARQHRSECSVTQTGESCSVELLGWCVATVIHTR